MMQIIYLISADVFLMLVGYSLCKSADPANIPTHYSHCTATDSVHDLIVELAEDGVSRGNYTRFRSEVRQMNTKDSAVKVSGSLLLYLRNSAVTVSLRCGDRIHVRQKLHSPDDPKNPEEFDQKKYLEYTHIRHLLFADSTEFVRDPHHAESTLWNAGMRIRRQVIDNIRNSGVNHDAFSVYAALITGYDEEIRSEVMDAFSKSGTLHILSVSGLHTGILYLVIRTLFDLMDRERRWRYLRLFFSVVILWAFALVSGFAPTVLRAVIMFTLLSTGELIYGKDNSRQLNILCVSAFIMLSYDPFLLWNIGFQLSYAALAGILCLQPWLTGLWKPASSLVSGIWSNMAATFSASIFTLPLTLYYFKQFPIWFLFSNLIIVPLSFVALMVALALACKLYLLSGPAELLIKFMIAFSGLFTSEGSGYIDHIDFNLTDALFLSVLLLLAGAALFNRSYRIILVTMVVLLLWQVNALLEAYADKQKELLAVYHLKKNSLVAVKQKVLFHCDSLPEKEFRYRIRNHYIAMNAPEIRRSDFNFAGNGQFNCVVLSGDQLLDTSGSARVKVLVICKNYRLSEDDLVAWPKVQKIVADGSNSSSNRRRIAKLCGKFGISCHITATEGAYVQEFRDETANRR